MIKFNVKIFLNDVSNTIEVVYNIREDTPEKALHTATEKQGMLEDSREVKVGDSIVVSNPSANYTGYFIINTGLKPKKVGVNEFQFWQKFIVKSRNLKELGVDVAFKDFLHQTV